MSALSEVLKEVGDSRLLEHRCIFISEPITSEVAKWVVTSLLNLEMNAPGKDIRFIKTLPVEK
mgnify:CR=1 FL=1